MNHIPARDGYPGMIRIIHNGKHYAALGDPAKHAEDVRGMIEEMVK
jgi:hypothetical protein